MSKDIGDDYKLYTSQSDPGAGADDEANYNLVGFATDLSFDPSRELIDASDKDSSNDTEYIPSRRDTEISGTFNLEKEHSATEEGQEDLWASMEGDDVPVFFLITDGVAGNQCFHGQGYVEDMSVSLPDQDMLQVEPTIRADGGFTRTDVPI